MKTLGIFIFVLLSQSSAFALNQTQEATCMRLAGRTCSDVVSGVSFEESDREIRRKCTLATQNVAMLTRHYQEALARKNTPEQRPGDIVTIALFNWRVRGAKAVQDQYCHASARH